jgi:hypothetical protein
MGDMYCFGNGLRVDVRLPRLSSHVRQTKQTAGQRHDKVGSRDAALHQTITLYTSFSRFEVHFKFVARLGTLDLSRSHH